MKKEFIVSWVYLDTSGECYYQARDSHAAIKAFRREYRNRVILGVVPM